MYTIFFALWWQSSNLIYRTKLQSSILRQTWINSLLSLLFSCGRRFSRNSCCNCHWWTFLRYLIWWLILNLSRQRTTRLYHHVFINSLIFRISIALLHLLYGSQRLQINILEINTCWSNIGKRSSMIKIWLAMALLN